MKRIPKLGLHKATGRGRVLLNGQTFYTKAQHGSPEALQEYAELIRVWEEGGRKPIKQAPRTPQMLASDPTTFGEAVDRFVAWKDRMGHYRKAGQATSSRGRMVAWCKDLQEFMGKTPLRRMNFKLLKSFRDHCEARVAKGQEMPATASRRQDILRMVLRWTVGQGWLPRSLEAEVAALRPIDPKDHWETVKKLKRPKRAVTWEEAVQVAKCAQEPLATMILVQRMLGCRPGELRELSWADVDQSGELWRWRPGHKTERLGHVVTYWIPKEAQPLMEKLRGLPKIHRSKHHRQLTAACEKAGVPRFTPHELRHGLITERANNPEIPIAWTSKSVGHRDIKTTLGYVHVSEDESAQAVLRSVRKEVN